MVDPQLTQDESDLNNNTETHKTIQNSRITRRQKQNENSQDIHEQPPREKPPFTLKQLRDVIPPACFERSLTKSMTYVIRDITYITILVFFSTYVHDFPLILQMMVWPIYMVFITGVLGGVFVLAHDCCHDAFSPYPLLNDIVGIILDSIVLVPYLGFKYAHHKHHRHTASYEFDNAHAPPQRSQKSQALKAPKKTEEEPLVIENEKNEFFSFEILEANFLYQVISLGFHFLYFSAHYFIVLWFKSDKLIGKKVSLFSPTSTHPFRSLTDVAVAALSDLLFLTSLSIVGYLVLTWGLVEMCFSWIFPIGIFWISFGFVTFLQHTSEFVPWYRDPEWNWMRGCLSTVDRSMGPILNYLTHDVAQYHAVHHLFPRIPFYEGRVATEAVRPILGKYYLRDDTNFLVSLYRAFINCKCVDSDSAVAFQRKFISGY